MWNPFKRKYKVPVDECINSIIAAIWRDRASYDLSTTGLWEWLEVRHGVKREWSWRTHQNYLVFDTERDFLLFLVKL